MQMQHARERKRKESESKAVRSLQRGVCGFSQIFEQLTAEATVSNFSAKRSKIVNERDSGLIVCDD